MFKPKTLVQYKGGGYDGCFWEWNYAFIDADGVFHDIFSSGYAGCKTVEKLVKLYQRRPQDCDLYDFSNEEERKRFGREAPISHLIGVGRWLSENAPDFPIPVQCDRCGLVCDATEASGVDPHGIGGVESEYGRIICQGCVEEGDE